MNVEEKELFATAKKLYKELSNPTKLKQLKPGTTRLSRSLVEKFGYEFEVDRHNLFLNVPGSKKRGENDKGEYIYRDFINYITVKSNYVSFRFKSTITDSRPRRSLLQKVKIDPIEHFNHLNEVATILALESGREYVAVESGRTDKKLLEKAGYQHEGKYNFIKKVNKIKLLEKYL